MIPFNKPTYLGTEVESLSKALQSHTSGNGPFTKMCEARLRALNAGSPTLLVTSCTHAMEMAALLLALKPGDEVIVPSFTFVSTANAFLIHGAKLVFADVDGHGNICPDAVARLIGPRTRAIVPVHYAGSSCDMDKLMTIAGSIPVIEDAAQALTSTFKQRPLGTWGALAAISFHETKNIGCGEGGALVINDPTFLDRAEYIREKGTNRRKFIDGHVDKYTWVDIGSSYVLSDLNAAYLWSQLEQIETIQERRRQIYDRYAAALGDNIERAGGYVITPTQGVQGNHHLFGIVLRNQQQRQAFIAHMREAGIATPFHYVPLHSSPMGKAHHDGRDLPTTDRVASCLVRLPLYFNLSDEEQVRVIASAQNFLQHT